MKRTQVESSQIHSVGYEPAEPNKPSRLEICFWSGRGDTRVPGSVYEYDNVTPEQHRALMGAESVGSHFGKAIKSNRAFPYRRLPDAKLETDPLAEAAQAALGKKGE